MIGDQIKITWSKSDLIQGIKVSKYKQTNRKDDLSMHELRNIFGFIKIMPDILDINIDAFGLGVNLK